ncbi:hypothetical protein SDC9_156795 [bioreactor metagenome]|uniref:Uncharacterized protein n=1 Tax=bioreactor metagenome TaxID=1076179 RepID=A0A645F575_9ZZZZ
MDLYRIHLGVSHRRWPGRLGRAAAGHRRAGGRPLYPGAQVLHRPLPGQRQPAAHSGFRQSGGRSAGALGAAGPAGRIYKTAILTSARPASYGRPGGGGCKARIFVVK